MVKKQNKCITAMIFIILIAALTLMGVSGYNLAGFQQVYASGDSSYDELRDLVLRRTDDPKADTKATASPQVEIPPHSIDFDALKKINPDISVWLYAPDTVIDYPVARATDYAWYLHHLPDGTDNLNGTLFLDDNCEPDLGGRLSIIYGHDMKSGKMFGSLRGYKKQAHFEKHPYMYLYTEQGSYQIDLKYGFAIGAG